MAVKELNNEEKIFKYLYENQINYNNYQKHEAILQSFFSNKLSYERFVKQNFQEYNFLSYKAFLPETEHMDAFFHPRFIQQSSHSHDFFEVKYQLQGTSTVTIGTEAIFLKQNDICMIAPSIPHLTEIFDANSYMINLVIIPEYITQLFPRLLAQPNSLRDFFLLAQNSMGAFTPYLHIHASYNEEIIYLVKRIFNYYSPPQKTLSPLNSVIAEANLEKMFLLLLQDQKNIAIRGNAQHNQIIKQMLDYIQEHLENISFAEFAEHFHYSESYASRFIKKCTGHTFTNLVKGQRLKKAAELLGSTSFTIEQIAAQTGYSGRTNFYQSFRKYYGVTPAEFRKNKRVPAEF